MAVRTRDLSKVDYFVHPDDPEKGTDKETRFHYRMLKSFELSYLNDQLTTLEGLPMGRSKTEMARAMGSANLRSEISKVAIMSFRLAITGIDNLEDDKGNPRPYMQEIATPIPGRPSREVVAESIVQSLPQDTFIPFYMELMEHNKVSKEEEKNSEGELLR